ncbi:hypothetical protein F7725_028812 [Dissostichus mawsoni]|uniref:TIR domain-containing protein n=1 Tax=Dissostichus mawsoni TaxID=36200 RepID=A0A7J5XGU5_DISMA|nr:hypothetical protein F7725_028812 [Dissostichus mawsoni]
MGAGVKDHRSMPKPGPKWFKLSFLFFLLNISSIVAPVTGFSVKSCRISKNTAICSKNELKSVPRGIPATVKGLDLSRNKISKLQMSNFKNLSVLMHLDIQRNSISQIDTGAFRNLISLKTLNLNHNTLVQLGDDLFEGLNNLTELRMNNNGIKAVSSTSLRSLTSLTLLEISRNKLHHITAFNSVIQNLPNLQMLSVEDNNLPTFKSWEMTNRSLKLTQLHLSQNRFSVFSITADVFPNLKLLNIGCTYKKQPLKWEVGKTFLSQVSTLDISGLQITPDDRKTIQELFNFSLTSLTMNSMKRSNLIKLINMSCTIPTVSILHLQRNNLFFIRSNLFEGCINVKELDLSHNRIRNISDKAFTYLQGLRILDLSQNKLSSVPAATSNLPRLEKLSFKSNNISRLECHDFTNLTGLRELYLHQNQISALQKCVFKDLIGLQVLKLEENYIYNLGDAFTEFLPNLTELHLNTNKLSAIQRGDFKGLQSLKNLSLHENQIKKLANGSFIGLTDLTVILLQLNSLKEYTFRAAFNDLIHLKRLDLRENHIQYPNDSALPDPPFSQLSDLEILAMPAQHRRLKSHLPRNFLKGLINLSYFDARNMQLLYFHKDMFSYTPKLQKLDISSNDLKDLSPDLFFPIGNLKSLYISRTSLGSLDFLIDANLKNLEFLQARNNEYSVISMEVIKSLPALAYIDLKGNSFTCDCDNVWFGQWAVNDPQTQVLDASNFKCNYPKGLKGKKLLDLDVRSCTVDIEFIYFITTTCTLLLFMVVTFTYHFLRWQLSYAYYIFLALLFDTKYKNKQAPNQYDAFISYNTHDEPWVIKELVPKLEEEQGFKLCLHHRDFEPGKPIIDNITDAIYGSRKTICVISRKYLESEWCSREIQVASFRLFDEQKDVLVLVFLEDIPTSQLSAYHRIRKLLKRQTYLSWPQAEEHPELFWVKLCKALKNREDINEDRLLLTVGDRP